ncbi:MAG: YfiR family protein [Verrucomicrobiales bacterium]
MNQQPAHYLKPLLQRGLKIGLARGAICALASLLLLLGSGINAQAQSREYALKAAFLFHFTQFVEWPAEAFAETNSPFVIGIIGADPFGNLLHDIVQNEKVKGRSIVVRRLKSSADSSECHILYLAPSEAANMDKLIKGVAGKPVLTVSDIETFARRGGMIRFITENNKIRFRINNAAAQKAGLTISSKLLRLAELVPTDQ